MHLLKTIKPPIRYLFIRYIFDIGIILFSVILMFLSLYQTVYPYFIMPEGRNYTFLEGFSEDYTQYVSFIKEGMYGRNFLAIRSVPFKQQNPTVIHILYILLGKAGGITGLEAPLIYHLSRVIIGILFVFAVYRFFRYAFGGDKSKAFFTTIFSFLGGSLSWYSVSNGELIFQTLRQPVNFATNLTFRVSSRPHYEMGAIIFLLIVMVLFFLKIKNPIKQLLIVFLSFMLGIIHTPFTIIILLSQTTISVLGVILKRISKEKILLCTLSIIGLCLGIFLSYLGTKQPYLSEVYADRGAFSLQQIKNILIFFGPLLWFGFPGLILGIFFRNRNILFSLFMLFWIIIQILFLLYFYRLIHSDPYRFIQSLYFVPLALGVANIFELVEKKRKSFFYLGMAIFISLSIPQYIYDFQRSLVYTKENWSNYSPFIFPSDNLMKAYKYLDKNTPKESTVLAGYEASRNILLYSHNFVLGNRQNWSQTEGDNMERERDRFLYGLMNRQQMIDYLKKYDVSYIYGGYQEKISKVLDENSDLFTSVYNNPEVTIYKVNLALK